MRLHYFFRVFDLHEQKIFDNDRFEAESRYLAWTASQPEFAEVWIEFEDQYTENFRAWVNQILKSRPNAIKSTAPAKVIAP